MQVLARRSTQGDQFLYSRFSERRASRRVLRDEEMMTKVEDEQEPGVRMSFGEHLEELRTRLIRTLIALGAAAGGALVFHEALLEVMLDPYRKAMGLLGIPVVVLNTDLGASAMAVLKLVMIVGFFSASPFVAAQVWGFVSAGLYEREKKYIRLFAPASFLLFVGGCTFGYFYLVPFSLYGLAQFLNPEVVSPTVDVARYLGLMMTLTLLLGAAFQLPLVMIFLSKIGLVAPSSYSRWRRQAVVGNFVAAAVISPPEVISLFVVVVPLLILYEAGVLGARLSHRTVRRDPIQGNDNRIEPARRP